MVNGTIAEDGYEAEERPRFPKNYNFLAGKLLNLDNGADFGKCRQKLMNEATRNFVVDFGNDEALGAFDLDGDEFSALLENPVCSLLYIPLISSFLVARTLI